MITADQAHKLKLEHKNMNIVARQREYIYTQIEGASNLGKSKYRWIAPDEFTKEEIKYIIESLRERGFEIMKDANYIKCDRSIGIIYEILW